MSVGNTGVGIAICIADQGGGFSCRGAESINRLACKRSRRKRVGERHDECGGVERGI